MNKQTPERHGWWLYAPALLPVLVCLALSVVLAEATDARLDARGLWAFCGGVWATYSLDALLDLRARVGRWCWRANAAQFAAGLAVMVWMLSVEPRLIPPIATFGCISTAYTFWKRILPKDVLIAAAWTVALLWLPLDGLDWNPGQCVLAGGLFLTLLANAVLCDLPDIETDRCHAVVNLSVALGLRGALAIAGLSSLLAVALLLFCGTYYLALPTVVYLFLTTIYTTRKKAPDEGFKLIVELSLLLPLIGLLA